MTNDANVLESQHPEAFAQPLAIRFGRKEIAEYWANKFKASNAVHDNSFDEPYAVPEDDADDNETSPRWTYMTRSHRF